MATTLLMDQRCLLHKHYLNSVNLSRPIIVAVYLGEKKHHNDQSSLSCSRSPHKAKDQLIKDGNINQSRVLLSSYLILALQATAFVQDANAQIYPGESFEKDYL